jgi:hypothetical protein
MRSLVYERRLWNEEIANKSFYDNSSTPCTMIISICAASLANTELAQTETYYITIKRNTIFALRYRSGIGFIDNTGLTCDTETNLL